MRLWIAGLCLALSLTRTTPAAAQDETDFVALFPSIVRVVGFSDDGVSLGSGAVVGKSDTGSYVITNYHVISGADAAKIRVVAPNREPGGKVIVSAARFVGGDSGTDIAILYVPNFSPAAVLPLTVGTARVNLAVRAIGFPSTDIQQWRQLNDEPTITDGIVSTSKTAPWRPGYPEVGQVQHTADLNEGVSGGPLLDLCGRVLAVNTAYNSVARGSNLALAAADVTPYLQRLNIAYKTDNTPCKPGADREKPVVQPPVAPVVKAPVKEPAVSPLVLAGAAAAGVLALGLGGFLVWRRTRPGVGGGAASMAGAAPPVETPPGILLKGVNEAAGKVRVIRAEELANPIGVELGKTDAFGSPGTSRRHARLVWAPPQGLVLRDVGSMNGTRVNGQEIRGGADRPINIGDIIEFGARDARYQVEKL